MHEPTLLRDDFKCRITVPVRWGDMDAVRHVNNSAYFTYCESARIEYFEQLGIGRFTETPTGPVLAHAALSFRRQVRYPAILEVGARVPDIGNRSFRMEYGIFFEATDTVVADGSSVVVWTDYREGRAIEVPQELRAAIESLEHR